MKWIICVLFIVCMSAWADVPKSEQLNGVRPKKVCHNCGRSIAITKKGKFYKHDLVGGKVCAVSGHAPGARLVRARVIQPRSSELDPAVFRSRHTKVIE